jgi:hypothetical protein
MYEFDKIKYGLEVADSIEHLIYTDLDSVPSCETAVLIFNDTISDYAWLAEQVAPISELYCAGKINRVMFCLISEEKSGFNPDHLWGWRNNEPDLRPVYTVIDSMVARHVSAYYMEIDYDCRSSKHALSKLHQQKWMGSLLIFTPREQLWEALYAAKAYNLSAISFQPDTTVIIHQSDRTQLQNINALCKQIITTFHDIDVPEYNDIDYRSMMGDGTLTRNRVAGHHEKDTIVGNFTGHGLDSLFVSCNIRSEDNEPPFGYAHFYLQSNNKKISTIELDSEYEPKLVWEGDLDGNGTDELGYLPVAGNSQWRTYRVLTLKNGSWYELTNYDLLDTPEYFRGSGCEVIEPGPKPGYVLIHYGIYPTFGAEQFQSSFEQDKYCIRDTIVKAVYERASSRISWKMQY